MYSCAVYDTFEHLLFDLKCRLLLTRINRDTWLYADELGNELTGKYNDRDKINDAGNLQNVLIRVK